MKLSLLQEHLLPPLNFVAKNVSFKAQLPITQHVLLLGEKGQLCLTTTTMETMTVATVAAKTEKEGGICVPSKLLTELIVSLPPGKIELEEKEQQLSITSGG